ASLAHHAPQRVDLHEAYALAASQPRFVLALESVLANLLPRFVALIARHRELGFGHLTHVAHERRDRGAIGIVALGRGLNDQSGEIDTALLEHRHDIE